MSTAFREALVSVGHFTNTVYSDKTCLSSLKIINITIGWWARWPPLTSTINSRRGAHTVREPAAPVGVGLLISFWKSKGQIEFSGASTVQWRVLTIYIWQTLMAFEVFNMKVSGITKTEFIWNYLRGIFIGAT